MMKDLIVAIEDRRPIEHVEGLMLSMEQAECPVRHIYMDGIYIRELTMKAGTLAIGHHQNFEHANVFLEGEVEMFNEDGSTTILTAPMTFKGQPGRKMGKVLKDVVWQNVYATREQSVPLLEAMYMTKSDEFLRNEVDKYCLEYAKHDEDRAAFTDALLRLSYTPEEVTEQVENEADQCDFVHGAYKIKIDVSPIDGLGVICTYPIEAGEVIGVARLGELRTPLGRYTNHARHPNAEMRLNPIDRMNYELVATAPIRINEEVTIDYVATVEHVRKNS